MIGAVTEFDWRGFDAVLFDLDGVITPTAEIHERAWAELFADVRLHRGRLPRATSTASPATTGCGRSSHRVTSCSPEGDPSDPPGADTVCALGQPEERAVQRRSSNATASRPTRVRRHARTARRAPRRGCDRVVVEERPHRCSMRPAWAPDSRWWSTARVAAVRHIAGKPAPDMFTHAADQLGVTPDRAVVVEDAVSGVAAGAPVDWPSSSASTAVPVRRHC